MENIAEFIPIQRDIKQDIINYYKDNNISFPDIPIIQEYFLEHEKEPLMQEKFYAGAVGSKSKAVKKPTQKQNPPRFPLFKPASENVKSSLN